MKNKKVTYLLLSCTVLIWIFLGFKVLKTFINNDDHFEVENQTLEKKTVTDNEINDTIELLLNYDDPFLSSPITKKGNRNNNENRQTTNVPSDIKWPKINYLGFFQAKPNKIVVSLQIDGEQILLRPGEVFREIELIKADAEQIELRMGNDMKAFSK